MAGEERRIVLAQAGMGDPRCRRLAEQLAGWGRLTVCVSLAHTLSVLEQASAEILFLDLDLPDASGCGSIARVRRSFPQMPIVAVVAEACPKTSETSRRAGAVACWTLDEATEWPAGVFGKRLAAIAEEWAPLGGWHLSLGCRLLLADPLESRRGPLAALLEIAGARVARAADGEATIVKALTAEERGDPYAAILLYDPLPGLDDCAAEVLREAGYRRPIIGLETEIPRGAKRDAFDEWLSAPLDRAALIEALRRCTN
jgi:CheY-like chemotaxis protein